MQKQDTWMTGPELAAALEIREARAAQIARCGMIDFVTSAGGALFHIRHVRAFAKNFPELLEVFRVEKEVDNRLELGECVFEIVTFPQKRTADLMKCVERHEATFPDKHRPPH